MQNIIIALTLTGMLATASPAFAVVTDADIEADQQAIAKDNAALKKDEATLARHRAEKASAKANNDTAGQAKSSLAIGADKAQINEKKVEKKVDQKILEHDQKHVSDQ